MGALASRLIFPGERPDMTDTSDGRSDLDAFNDNVVSGGPGKDGIPSIDSPKFISRAEADDFLRPEDIVFGIHVNGEVRAYPQRILVWHEIVNDSFEGRQIAITYCPLTGSQIALEGGPGNKSALTFGTTGKLVNSNLLMYDRQTDSDWPQILATAINGAKRGERLSEVPLVWTTWDKWRTRHPNTRVLGTDTGFIRNYSSDPYGSYSPGPGGYYATPGLWFPVMSSSDLLSAKKVVFGTGVGDERLAIPLEEFRSVGVDNITLGEVPLSLFYESQLDTIRVFRRRVEAETLTFVQRQGRIVDEETESVWSPEGVAIEGPFQGSALEQVNAFNVMWFAWYAFYPDTLVYQSGG
ncbi:MAG: DUF3179 domain-containing protein [Candidatus Thermoplasmatota archaeon]|nr:DUF3179 domain-containing protein [Candidatus Thermoplasmatota archaeon]